MVLHDYTVNMTLLKMTTAFVLCVDDNGNWQNKKESGQKQWGLQRQ